MAEDSIRKRILVTLVTRLQAISQANGFSTDAGLQLFVGVLPKLGPDDPEAAIAVLPGTMTPTFEAEHVVGEWPVEIIAVANASANRNAPFLIVEDVLADIHRAVELPDRTLGGLVRKIGGMEVGEATPYGREAASEVVAVSQAYRFQVQRVYGHPEVAR